MKTKTFLSLSSIALAATLAWPVAASAQPGAQAPHARHVQHKMAGAARADAGMRALQLTEAQRDQIFKIRQDQAQAVYDQRKAERNAASKLRELSSADSFDEAQARSLAEELGKAQGQLALLKAQKRAQILAVLTPEQRQKFAEMGKRRGAHGKMAPAKAGAAKAS